MKPMLAPSVAPSAGSNGETPAARDTAIAIGMMMLAAAVFEAASDNTMATPVKTTVRPTLPMPGKLPGDPVPDRRRQASGVRQPAHRQAAAKEQHDAPVDA